MNIMNKEEVINKIKDICAHLAEFNDASLGEIESIIKSYLENHPQDTEMWLRLAKLELTPPWEDPDRIVGYLNVILSYDPHTILAILMRAYIEDLFFGGMKEATRNMLYEIASDDAEVLSMIEYAKAIDFLEVNKNQYIKHLKKSIAYSDKDVNNFKLLGKYYIKHGNIEEGHYFIKKALDNIQGIYAETVFDSDITDINNFFNYYYKGIYTTKFVKEDLEQLLHDS